LKVVGFSSKTYIFLALIGYGVGYQALNNNPQRIEIAAILNAEVKDHGLLDVFPISTIQGNSNCDCINASKGALSNIRDININQKYVDELTVSNEVEACKK
jgi:hypothetical protein